MKLVAAKCPCCNANIEVAPNAETTKCRYCGSAILVEDAIKKYTIEFSGVVSISGISSLENDLKLGSQYLEVKEWTNAYRMFSNAVEKKADSYDAWHGCLCALTQNFSFADKSWVPISGSRGLEFVILNCIKNSNYIQRPEIIKKLSDFLESHSNRVRSDIMYYHRYKKIRRIFFFISLSLFLVDLILSAYDYAYGFTMITFLIGLLLIVFSFFMMFWGNSQETYLNSLKLCINKVISE